MTVMVDSFAYKKVAERGKPGTASHTAVLAPTDKGRRDFIRRILLMPILVFNALDHEAEEVHPSRDAVEHQGSCDR